MRWDPGFLSSGAAFERFWAELGGSSGDARSGLFIAGRGFDSRTPRGARTLWSAGFPITKCCLIHLTNQLDPPDRPRSVQAADNESLLRHTLTGAEFDLIEVETRNRQGRYVGSSRVQSAFGELRRFEGFTDVVVDITALPTSIAFPLLGKLISMSDRQRELTGATFNLHCIVCEDPRLDELVSSEGGDQAEFIQPFHGVGGLEGDPDPINIWTPVLGERQAASLLKIRDFLDPQEVKPFLPFLSANPRRGDDLIAEYHSLLFETFEVDPTSFIYADERDPFDIYRQLTDLALDYTTTLAPLGTVRVVVSSHTSKLLSLGALLAACESSLAVAHVEPTNYRLLGPAPDPSESELFEIWLTGEAYG